MADNKKDHFVPQFYLRNFALSISAERKLIGLYHLPSKRFQARAQIANEAYENYYYQNDSINNLVAKTESRSGTIFAEMTDKESVPPFKSPEYATLLNFLLIQSQRTPMAAQSARQQYELALKWIRQREGPESPRAYTFAKAAVITPAVLFGCLRFILDLALDLRCKLLRNTTKTPFITSDNPVVGYNQLYESDLRSTNTGLACRGLQLFLPLSPRLLLVWFDPDVYRIGNANPLTPCVDVQTSDIDGLNTLQVMNANEDLYFGDEITELYLKSLIKRADAITGNSKREVTPEARFENILKHRLFDLVEFGKITHKMDLRLDCISLLPNAERYASLAPEARERNPLLARNLEAEALKDDELPDDSAGAAPADA